MNQVEPHIKAGELEHQARRARRIIYLAMGLFIVLPLLLVWLTGAIQF